MIHKIPHFKKMSHPCNGEVACRLVLHLATGRWHYIWRRGRK